MPVELIDIIKPKNNAQFPMVEDIDFKGGYRTVQNVTNRDGVPMANRKPNMLVYTKDEDKLWKWSSPWVDDTTWVEIVLNEVGGGFAGEQGLTNRRTILDIISSFPLISDFRSESAVAEIQSAISASTWIPDGYTLTSVGFTVPAIFSNVTITVNDATAYSILTTPAQVLFVEGIGYFRVDGVSGNDVDGYNYGTYQNHAANAAPGTIVGIGVAVSLPFGNFGDSVVFGYADGSGFGYDEFSKSETFSVSAGSSGLNVIAVRDLILSGGSQGGNTFLIKRHANSGTITSITGPTGTLAGGAVISGGTFDNFPTIKRGIGQFVWFSSPSDGNIYAYNLDGSPSIIQANLGILTKPHGMVIVDDGYMWVCDRQDDTTANATLTQYLPLTTGSLNGTDLGAITGFLAQSQLVYTGRYIFGLDCSDGYAALHRFDLTTHNINTFTFETSGTPDRSSLCFDGVGLWVTTKNTIYRLDPSNYDIQYSYTDPTNTIDYGIITTTASGKSILIAFINTSNSNVGVKELSYRKIINTDRLRVSSISPNSNVITNSSGELVSGSVATTLSGDVIGTSETSIVQFIHGVTTPMPGLGDDGKAIVYDELNNRYVPRAIGNTFLTSSTVGYGPVTNLDIEGQNAPILGPITDGYILPFHKPSYGRDSFSMQPSFRWPNRARGMELYFASATATDLIFMDSYDGYLAVLHDSIGDFPITLHDPGSGQQVSQLPSSTIGSSGWDSIYYVTQEKITDGTDSKLHYVYLQKSGTNEMARVNVSDGYFDLISSPSSINGPIYVHESGILAWMAGGTLVYIPNPCDAITPTIQTSSLTGADSDATSSLVVVPSVYNVSFSQSGFMPKAWVTQPLTQTLIECDFPFGTNSSSIVYDTGDGYTRPRQIAFDGTFLYVNAMSTGYPGDATLIGEIARFDPVSKLFIDHDDITQGCSFDGALVADGKFLIASDSTKTTTNVTTNNQDSIHIRSTNMPIVSTTNGLSRMGGLRIAQPKKIKTPQDGSQFFGLYAICNADTPGIYRYIDRAPLFTKTINLAGGFIDHIERSDGNYNITSFDSTIVLHDLTSNVVITLPVNPILGQTFIIIDEDGSLATFIATIDGNGFDINGSPVYIMGGTLLLARQSITVKFTGNSWSLC